MKPEILIGKKRNTLCKIVGIFIFFSYMLSCSSTQPDNSGDILEPIDETAQLDTQQDASSGKPAYDAFVSLLESIGYRAVGMQFESEESLNFLSSVFSRDEVRGRAIDLIYTGLRMSYDEQHRSLTIGGTNNLEEVLTFIKANVPVQTGASQDTPAATE